MIYERVHQEMYGALRTLQYLDSLHQPARICKLPERAGFLKACRPAHIESLAPIWV